jgi:tripartite-type tricarboxylate transporter receptor subunit TctC
MIALGLLAPVMLWARPAAAETWPQRPVKFLLPLGAGSGVDIGARLLADGCPRAGASRSWSRTGPAAMPSSRSAHS